MCIKAVSTLGLVFGGVDLIMEKETKAFYITEVNSSPSLNSINIKKYINCFIEYIKKQKGIEQ
jgi:glutathione synthase/RimK-type ligase-like ATP-grasp enzyme